MRLLLDTHVLVWAVESAGAEGDLFVSTETIQLMSDADNELYFSPVAVWEVAIKNALGRAEFRIDPSLFRRALLDSGYLELPITSAHAAAVGSLPMLHRDPFDRILIAQASAEGMMLLTKDAMVLRYPGPIRRA